MAQAIDSIIVELLLVEIVGRQAELEDRNARSIVLHDNRRLDADWHKRANGIRCRNDLRDREVEIDVRLKVDLLDREAVQGLRLDVLDAGHVGAHGVLAVCRNALLHLRRAEAGVLPDHGHDRNVDLREDVGRHGANRRDAEKQNQGGQHIEGMGKSQRKSNDAHVVYRHSPGIKPAPQSDTARPIPANSAPVIRNHPRAVGPHGDWRIGRIRPVCLSRTPFVE